MSIISREAAIVAVLAAVCIALVKTWTSADIMYYVSALVSAAMQMTGVPAIPFPRHYFKIANEIVLIKFLS